MRIAFLTMVVLSVWSIMLMGCQDLDSIVVTVPEPIDEGGEYDAEYVVTLENGDTVKGVGKFTVIILTEGPADLDGPPILPKEAGRILVNINTADLDELCELPGIGPVKAAAIILYRTEVDGFDSIEELENVKGIGPKTMDVLRVLITVG